MNENIENHFIIECDHTGSLRCECGRDFSVNRFTSEVNCPCGKSYVFIRPDSILTPVMTPEIADIR
jgi:hypothetical protein